MPRAEEPEPNGTVLDEPERAGSGEELHASLSAHLTEIIGHLSRLARIRVMRVRLRTGRVVFLALSGILLALVTAAAALAGVRLVIRGVSAGLLEVVDGRVWLAELWSGLILLAGTGLLLVSVHSWSERRLLRGLRRRHGAGETGP